MRIEIEIPKEFEEHFKQDKFKDSLERIMADIWHSLEIGNCLCAGNYEYETIKMLAEALENSRQAYDVDKVVKELEEMKTIKGSMKTETCRKWDYGTVDKTIEVVKQGGVSDDTDAMCEWKKYPFTWFTGCDGCEINHKQGDYCPRCGKRIKVIQNDN